MSGKGDNTYGMIKIVLLLFNYLYKNMNGKKLGLVLGSSFAFLHFVWSVLIFAGLAQSLMDSMYKMHSLSNPFTVMPFDFSRSIGLIIMTFIGGYIIGNLFALFWNKFHK